MISPSSGIVSIASNVFCSKPYLYKRIVLRYVHVLILIHFICSHHTRVCSSEERRLAKFEAEQAAKEAAAEAAAAKAKKGGLFGAAKAGPSRLQMKLEKEAKTAARKRELEQKKFAAALEKRAKENKAAFDKKQKEKKKKEAQRRRVLKTDFQQRKGLGRFAKKK